MPENLKQYLTNNNFSKQLKQLKEKLKNKRVAIYGTGELFKAIIENYDLSGLNIIGITDRRYLIEDKGKTEYGYKIIPYPYFNSNCADYILVAMEDYQILYSSKKFSSHKTKIIPFIKQSLIKKIQIRINNIRWIQNFRKQKRNTFVLIKENGEKIYNPKIKNLEIRFWGQNSTVEINAPFYASNRVIISCGNNSSVKIGGFNNYKNTLIIMHNNNQLEIGENTSTEDTQILLTNCENTKVTIGKDCMISYNVILRTSDGHSIYDKDSRELLTPAQNITIGNHVWIGANSTILKGVQMPSNCMIGANSLVNKTFSEENCIIAGTPAKIIKTNINWDRRGPNEFR